MRRAFIGCALALAVGAGSSRAEKPKVDGIFPAGGKRGTEFEVAVTGSLDPWPLQAVCHDGRITLVPGEKEKGKYRVKIPPEVEAGPVLVHFFNKEGATAPRQFVVGDCEERSQTGAAVMAIPLGDLPLTVNGKLESGGAVDRFSFEMKAGEMVVADVAAYALDSPLDPLLHMRGPRGEQLAFNHDATRLGLDPRLVFVSPAAGTYELHLSAFAYPPKADIRFTGGASAIYRLNLSRDPPKIDLPEPREAEGEDAQMISVPSAISGRIDPVGDSDRFRIGAKKGEVLRFEIAAAAIGSWMDPVLVIRDGAGKELKREDDTDKDKPDVALDWTVPADDEFTIEVLDLNGNAGEQVVYRLAVSKPEPEILATMTGGEFAIEAGKKTEVAVKVARRYGFKGELEVGVEGLPPGITAAPVAVSEKGEAKLTLEAAPDAAPANVPMTLWAGRKGEAKSRVPVRIELKGTNTDAGDLLINRSERGWLTVLEGKKP